MLLFFANRKANPYSVFVSITSTVLYSSLDTTAPGSWTSGDGRRTEVLYLDVEITSSKGCSLTSGILSTSMELKKIIYFSFHFSQRCSHFRRRHHNHILALINAFLSPYQSSLQFIMKASLPSLIKSHLDKHATCRKQ